MNLKKYIYRWASAQIILSILLNGQTSPYVESLHDNMSKLEGSITADRTEYFTGEVAIFTIKVKNPTGAPLLVPTPFRFETERLWFSRRVGPGQFEDVQIFDIYLPQGYTDQTPSITLAPGEERTLTLRSLDNHFDTNFRLMGAGGVPAEPGFYQLTYPLARGANMGFQTVRPTILEKVVQVRLRQEHIYPPEETGGAEERIPLYRYVFALRHNGRIYICATYRDSGGRFPFDMDVGRILSDSSARSFSPYKRLVNSASPIVELNATLDPLDNLDITWKDSTGLEQRIVVNPTTLEPQ